MYPYNVNKYNHIQGTPKNPDISASESYSENKFTPKPDKKLLEMVEQGTNESRADAQFYQALMKIVRDTEDAEIIRSIYINELKHVKLFQELYYMLTGKKPPLVNIQTPQPSPVIKENYSKNIFHSLDEANFYRQIYFSFLNNEIRDILFEIITDEQNTASKFNYLFAK